MNRDGAAVRGFGLFWWTSSLATTRVSPPFRSSATGWRPSRTGCSTSGPPPVRCSGAPAAIRKDLVALPRVLPMREVVNAALRHRKDSNAPTELDAWYGNLYDHVLRANGPGRCRALG